MGNIVWKILSVAAALGASVVARKITDGTWKFVSGKESPENPEDPEIDVKEAVAFAVLSGAVIGLARMLANRQATRVYTKATGQLPKTLAKKGEN